MSLSKIFKGNHATSLTAWTDRFDEINSGAHAVVDGADGNCTAICYNPDDGNIYAHILGNSASWSEGNTYCGIAIAWKLSTGERQWVKTFDPSASLYANGFADSVAPVSGGGALFFLPETSENMRCVEIDSSGSEVTEFYLSLTNAFEAQWYPLSRADSVGDVWLSTSDAAVSSPGRNQGVFIKLDESSSWDILYDVYTDWFAVGGRTSRIVSQKTTIDSNDRLIVAGQHATRVSEGNTLQSASASPNEVVLDSVETFADDEINGMLIYISSGTGSGQQNSITDYVASTKTASISLAWDTLPDNTSVYSIANINREACVAILTSTGTLSDSVSMVVTGAGATEYASAHGIAVDDSDNIYVAWFHEFDSIVTKFNSSLVEQWTIKYADFWTNGIPYEAANLVVSPDNTELHMMAVGIKSDTQSSIPYLILDTSDGSEIADLDVSLQEKVTGTRFFTANIQVCRAGDYLVFAGEVDGETTGYTNWRQGPCILVVDPAEISSSFSLGLWGFTDETNFINTDFSASCTFTADPLGSFSNYNNVTKSSSTVFTLQNQTPNTYLETQ